MQQQTAFKYISEISRRVHAVNGLLATPGCKNEAARISRVWVFGSTVKGKKAPADLDILIEVKPVGRRRIPAKRGGRMILGDERLRDGKTNKSYLHAHGIRVCESSEEYAIKWLTKNMRFVSRHTTDHEAARPIEMTLIYPRFDADFDAIRKIEYVNDKHTVRCAGQAGQDAGGACA